jgi:hypothetical protein
MGFGNYSFDAHQMLTVRRSSQTKEQVFTATKVHPLMNPFGIKVRESRDSPTHPKSLGIVFALDVTGSMGDIPDLLARRELPTFMKALLDFEVPDPQVLFMFVGDATTDAGPLQVGQFESSEKEMDQWLTWSWLEGGGGGQDKESYEIAMYFAARHIDMDCWRKRKKRGYFFMTGDELPYPAAPRSIIRSLLGDDVPQDVGLAQVADELQRIFEPFFLIPDQSRRDRIERKWRDLFGDRVICMDGPEDTCNVTAGIVGLVEGALPNLDALAERLSKGGVPNPRIGAVVRALTPFAATLGRDGAPEPRLEMPTILT